MTLSKELAATGRERGGLQSSSARLEGATRAPPKTYKRVGLLGVGLIGSSVALGLSKCGIVETWVGMDTDKRVIQDALRLGVIQEMTTDLEELVQAVDWLLVAVPVKDAEAMAARIVPLIQNPDYFIVDVGSTKKNTVACFDGLFAAHGKANAFVGCHPIAGKEKTGPLAADGDLFQGKTVYVTPSPATRPEFLQTVDSLWKALGGQVRSIAPEAHDEVLAISSHLPHVIAFALMDAVQSGYESRQITHSLGGGLKDMTRVVASSPEMWSQICIDNQANILKQVEVFRRSLDDLYHLIKTGDERPLREFFLEKKLFRDVLE